MSYYIDKPDPSTQHHILYHMLLWWCDTLDHLYSDIGTCRLVHTLARQCRPCCNLKNPQFSVY